jgi:hypothetical protein
VLKATKRVLFLLLVLLAAYLRMAGLSWGLESGYGHLTNYQPDEFISLRGVLQLDLLSGDLTAPGAYFEGTFNYYLWALPMAGHELLDGQSNAKVRSEEEIKSILSFGRLMSVIFDLCTTVVVFMIIWELTKTFWSAYLGALLYGIVPMQVIYSHFMRTHLLSNLLCSLVILLSLRVLKCRRWWLFVCLGVLTGLAAATRYPIGVIGTIPCLLLLFERRDPSLPWNVRIGQSFMSLVSGPVWLLGLGCFLGLFLGEPVLFLDPHSVLHAVSHETFRYIPAEAGKLLNVGPLWQYVAVLVPYAMYPLLWILAYVAVAYLCFRRHLYHVTMPLLLFAVFYTYPMAKGYIVIFARQVMLLLPVFSVLAGLAFYDLWVAWNKRRSMAITLVSVVVLIAVPSIAFDWAYIRAMRQTDPRTSLRNDLKQLVDNSVATIGVRQTGGYFYTAMPAVDQLRSKNVIVRFQEPTEPADFFVEGFERPLRRRQLDAITHVVENEGAFKYVRAYSMSPSIFDKAIDLSSFPRDMTYPFPTILLFRAPSKL